MSVINNILALAVDSSGAQAALAKFSGSAHNAGKATEKFERTTKNLTIALGTLGGMLGLRQLIEYADTWTLINSRIRIVTSSHEQARQVQMKLYDITQKSRNSLAATGVLYTRLAINADQLGRSQQDLLDVVEAVNNAVLVSGATGVEAAQSIRQISQAFGKGKLDGDEFRTVMEAMPLVQRAIADEMGVTIGALQDLAQQGKITANIMIDAMLNAQKKLAEQSEGMQWTVGQSFLLLRNSLSMIIGILNMASGVTAKLSDGMRWLATNIDKVIAAVGALITVFLVYRATMISVAAVQAIVAAAQTIKMFYELATAVRSMADAMLLAQWAGKGFVGIVATLAAMGVGWLAYKKFAGDIAEATKKWTEANSDLTKGIGEFTAIEDKAAQKTRDKIEDMKREAYQSAVLAGLSKENAEIQQVHFDAINKRIEARRELDGALLNGMLEAIDIEERMAIVALDTKFAIESATNAIKEQAKIVERFADNLQRSFGDVFEKILNDGLEKFSDLFSAIKQMFYRLLSDMMAAKMMQKIGGKIELFLTDTLPVSEETAVFKKYSDKYKAEAAGYLGLASGKIPAGTTRTGEAVHLATISEQASKSWAAQNAKYLGPVIAGFLTGRMVGGMTENVGLGTLGGAASGALAGAAYGSIIPGIGTGIGAAIGGLSGAIGGLMGSMNAQKERDAERKNILKANTQSIRELTESFSDARAINEHYTAFLNLLAGSIGGKTTRGGWERMSQPIKDMILKIADELGIVLLNKNGKYVKGTMEQLAEAAMEAVRQLTTFGANLQDIESKQSSYNRIFGIEDTAQQGLEDAFDVLSQMAPQLMQQLGLTNLDLTSEMGREALRSGFQEIWNMINEGLLTPELLGAFEDKNGLLDAILKVVDGMEKFAEQLYNVTTDFPRAMDIIYYEQKFGKYGLGNSDTLREDNGVGTRRTDPTAGAQGGGFVVYGGVHITTTGDESGEEILSKIEYAAQQRRSRGGQVSVDTGGTF